ncbi:MAG TPA: MFS transporter, partial [Anaeromyxobacteraceae bacterium]|nr:MFS transporter [Anaeromyxobacteraceae bacterium]
SWQAFWPLVFLPILPLGPEGRRTVLVVVAGVHHGLGMVANNAWNSWMGELVPPALRGRYFGRRTALCTVAGGLCALAAGLALDRGLSRGSGGRVLEGLALVACLAGAASAFLMSRQHARPRRGDEVCFSLGAMVRPFADRRARGLLAYTVAWYGACGLSAPFFGLYLLRDLGLGYGQLAAQGAGLALAKVASTSRFGRVVDRLGSRRVLLACTAGLAASPVAWIASTAGHAWPLVVETAVGGVLLGGHAVASFALPLEVAPPRERPLYLAAVAVAGGAAFAATSALGGAVAGAAAVAPLRPILAGSAGLRLVAVLAALALPRRGGALRAANGPGEPAAKAEPVRRAA